jgi:hypothetical protein
MFHMIQFKKLINHTTPIGGGFISTSMQTRILIPSALMNHWSSIQHDINVFCGCVSRIETKNQSGASIDDKVCQHSSMYLFWRHVLCNKFSNTF